MANSVYCGKGESVSNFNESSNSFSISNVVRLPIVLDLPSFGSKLINPLSCSLCGDNCISVSRHVKNSVLSNVLDLIIILNRPLRILSVANSVGTQIPCLVVLFFIKDIESFVHVGSVEILRHSHTPNAVRDDVVLQLVVLFKEPRGVISGSEALLVGELLAIQKRFSFKFCRRIVVVTFSIDVINVDSRNDIIEESVSKSIAFHFISCAFCSSIH